jgi:hypothetical protein
MLRNLTFAAIALFWVVMNALLWRSEIGHGHDLASAVPPATVWEKILKAPDDSNLSIMRQGRKLGHLRFRPNLEEVPSGGKIVNENEPQGILKRLSEYTIEIDGSFLLEMIGRSVRLRGTFAFDPELRWKRFETEANIKPTVWQLKSNSEERALWLQVSEGESDWVRRFEFDDLGNPQRLLQELNSPILSALLPQYLPSQTEQARVSLALPWEARSEWLQIGRSKVRVYRLQARFLDQHQIAILVSRVGEILRVELPGDFKLISDLLFAG